jgi:hypothetical protein
MQPALLATYFLLVSHLATDSDGGCTFLKNTGGFLPDYTILNPRILLLIVTAVGT